VTFTRVDIQDIRQPQLPIYSSTGAGAPGTSAGTELPNEVALVMTLRTGGIGPQNRGRLYIPGWATNALGAGNVVAAGAVTAAGGYQNVINQGLVAGGLSWGLMQPARQAYTGSTGTQHPARTARIVALTVALIRDNHWDSQRRRGLK
jgi:hypothetical protein